MVLGRRFLQSRATTTLSISDHPLAPVVEGGQLADDGTSDGVGLAQVVVAGRSGRSLHLAHHVVPEIPDQSGMQRGQVRQLR
jgi:hypothetical protein